MHQHPSSCDSSKVKWSLCNTHEYRAMGASRPSLPVGVGVTSHMTYNISPRPDAVMRTWIYMYIHTTHCTIIAWVVVYILLLTYKDKRSGWIIKILLKKNRNGLRVLCPHSYNSQACTWGNYWMNNGIVFLILLLM